MENSTLMLVFAIGVIVSLAVWFAWLAIRYWLPEEWTPNEESPATPTTSKPEPVGHESDPFSNPDYDPYEELRDLGDDPGEGSRPAKN